jgi:hypothetical protein
VPVESHFYRATWDGDNIAAWGDMGRLSRNATGPHRIGNRIQSLHKRGHVIPAWTEVTTHSGDSDL